MKDYPEAACLFSLEEGQKLYFIQQIWNINMIRNKNYLEVGASLISPKQPRAHMKVGWCRHTSSSFSGRSHIFFPDASPCLPISLMEIVGVAVFTIFLVLCSHRDGCAEERAEVCALIRHCYVFSCLYCKELVFQSVWCFSFLVIFVTTADTVRTKFLSN